jgi:hypothetical protein
LLIAGLTALFPAGEIDLRMLLIPDAKAAMMR